MEPDIPRLPSFMRLYPVTFEQHIRGSLLQLHAKFLCLHVALCVFRPG